MPFIFLMSAFAIENRLYRWKGLQGPRTWWCHFQGMMHDGLKRAFNIQASGPIGRNVFLKPSVGCNFGRTLLKWRPRSEWVPGKYQATCVRNGRFPNTLSFGRVIYHFCTTQTVLDVGQLKRSFTLPSGTPFSKLKDRFRKIN